MQIKTRKSHTNQNPLQPPAIYGRKYSGSFIDAGGLWFQSTYPFTCFRNYRSFHLMPQHFGTLILGKVGSNRVEL